MYLSWRLDLSHVFSVRMFFKTIFFFDKRVPVILEAHLDDAITVHFLWWKNAENV